MQRPGLLRTYRAQVATYLKFKYGLSDTKADAISLEICKSNYKPLTAVIEETLTDNKPVIKAVDLASWFDKQCNNLITPSGSVYCQHEKKIGTIIEMIVKFMAKRKAKKKAMLKAKANSDVVGYLTNYFAQTSIKIFINALPGNFGSPYSLFYDKGNYNAITSSGRALIGYAYSEIEAVLGGNFMWLTLDDLRIYIMTQLHHGLDETKIEATMKKYGLKRRTKEELYGFYVRSLSIYNRYTDYGEKKAGRSEQFFKYNGYQNGDLAKIQEIVWKLNDTQVQYFYYAENLRHIMMENTTIFRPFIQSVFDYNAIDQSEEADPQDLFKIDGGLVTMINVAFHEHVDPGDSKIQVYDLPTAKPELAKRFVRIARHVEKKLKKLDDLFDTFIYTAICRPNVQHQPLMYRNSAVVSDTDSVIFTVKDWVEWYTGSVYSIEPAAYHIAMLMIYWITKAVASALEKYSIAQGANGKYTKTMAMKNEFLYPVMIQADVKKHYAGVITVQEGVILPEPDIDIKGGQFRGSDVPKVATKFAENFISKCLDGIYRHGRISAHDVINEVRDFEMQIYQDIQDGKTDWYKSASIKPEKDYANPMSSPWYYYFAWQHIFAPKYGDLMPPMKCPVVPINPPTEQYWNWLMKQDKGIAKRWIEFIKQNPRHPSYMAVNTVGGKVPPELRPLIKVKDIIHHTVKPCHLFLRQLPVNCGFEDSNNLFSEIYPLVKGRKLK